METKKYYWIKLKTDFFNQDTIDFLLSQNNGCEYVVLYQMLCLKTANNNGLLATNVGEIIVPYDINKITRDTKYFNEDTIRVALELYKQLGLIYEGDNSILTIAGLDEMIGSETKWAEKKRLYREKQKLLGQSKDNVLQDIDIEKDIDIDIDNKKENIKRKKFNKPTIEEIAEYCKERNNGIKAETFYDFYESKNWFIGKSKMVDWKACIRTWEQRQQKSTKPSWLDQEIKKQELTEKEEKELDELLKEFKE